MAAAREGHRRGPAGLLWLAAAVVLSLSVLAINGVPLYYFDSVGYKVQGDSILDAVLPAGGSPGDAQSGGGSGGSAGSGADDEDGQVNVTRSPTYAVLVALAWAKGPPYAMALLNLVAVFAAAALAARAVSRATFGTAPDLTMIAAPVAIAALTSLPFYVAYVMPDTFAAIAILVMAVVVAYSRHMTAWELLVALALLAFSVTVHRSHLLIVGLAVPAAALVMLLTARRHLWLVAGLIAAAALAGVVEIGAYSTAAKKVSGKEPSFRPFITARLVSDGPGYTYLRENCPDAEIPSCPLAEALEQSDNPLRFNAENIMFERTEDLGSFRLLPPEDQLAVARDQRTFFFRVLADQPVGVVAALIGNTLDQTRRVSVHMTVPDEKSIAFMRTTLNDPGLDVGTLAEDRSWVRGTNAAQATIYLVSLAVIVTVLAWPGLATREMRIFAGFLVLGILINAFVCGAVAQPAARYGARVVWLLPFLATLLMLVALRRRTAADVAPRNYARETAK